MPEEIKPDVPVEEQSTPADESAVQNGVAEMDEDSADVQSDAAVEELAEEGSGNASEANAEAAMPAMTEENDKDEASPSAENVEDEFPDLSGVQMEKPMANVAEFQQLSPTPSAEDNKGNIDLLLDVKMPVSIELGRTEMPISELLVLGPGSVVELNKLAGEPVDLLVNHRIIAKGEVVVVDENFGVRITQLLSPEERLKSLARE